MRGRVVAVLVAVVALVSAGTLAHATSAGSRVAAQPMKLDVTGWQQQEAGAPTPSAADGIGPGSYLLITTTEVDPTFGGTAVFICTANFVWTIGSTSYLGAAGHCFLPEGKEAALGKNSYVKQVEVCVSGCAFGGQLGGSGITGTFVKLGSVYYARQSRGGVDIGNDFGLVQIPSSLGSKVRPGMPVWGGPTGVGNVDTGSPVCVYGNGIVLGETFGGKARAGLSDSPPFKGSWEAALPSAGGDSGGPIVDCSTQKAVGILTHGLVTEVGPISWGTTTSQAIAMVKKDTGKSITLRKG